MVRQHPGLNGHEFEQTLGDNEGQESLACCSPWGLKESDATQRLNSKHPTAVKYNAYSKCLVLEYTDMHL